MDIFLQELKRQLNAKRLVTYILIASTLAVLWARFIVGGATSGFMQTGCYKGYKGKAAIEIAAKDRNLTAGEMTEDKFQSARDVFINSLKGEDEKDIAINKELLKYAVYADSLVTQQIELKTMRGEAIKGYLNLPKEAGRDFYKNEDLYYRSYIDKNAHNEKEKKLALSMWEKVKKPYTYYSGYGIWSDGIEHTQMFSFVLMIMVSVFAGAIIAKDKENGMDEIMVATVKGRRELTVAKIVIPWIMAFIIYMCGVGLYLIILKNMLPNNALSTSLQIKGTSFLPYVERDLLRMIVIFGTVGILTITSFTTLISSLVKKSSRAIEISIMTILVAFMDIFISMDSTIINIIKILIPGGLVISTAGFYKFPIVTMGGKAFLVYPIVFIVSIIIFLLSTLFTALNYRRR